MAKFTTYLIIMTGLVLLFHFTGLTQECGDDGLCKTTTPNSALLALLLSPEDFQNTSLTLKILLAIQGLLAAAIVVGFAIGGNIELGVMSIPSIFLFNLMWDFLAVFDKASSVNPVFAILLFAPLLIAWVTTSLEWWRGVTT